MPVVTVEMWQGRTVEQKKRLVEGITEACAGIGIPREQVTVILKDNPKHNWGQGGKLAEES